MGHVVKKMNKSLEQKPSEETDKKMLLLFLLDVSDMKTSLCRHPEGSEKTSPGVQPHYLAFTFISRSILTVTVSHSFLALQVYGTAGVRVFCKNATARGYYTQQ